MNYVNEQPIIVPTQEEIEKDHEKCTEDFELSRELKLCYREFEHYKERVKAHQERR